MMERRHRGLLVYSLPWGHLNDHVDSLCDNPLNGTFMSSAPLRTFHFNDDNCWRASLSCIRVCIQACVSVYLVGAPRSMKWLLLRMEWPSLCDNRSTKIHVHLGSILEPVFGTRTKMGMSRVALCRCGAEPDNGAFFSSALPPSPPRGSSSGTPGAGATTGSRCQSLCVLPLTVSLLNPGLPFLCTVSMARVGRAEGRGKEGRADNGVQGNLAFCSVGTLFFPGRTRACQG